MHTMACPDGLKECTIPLVTFGGPFADHLADHFRTVHGRNSLNANLLTVKGESDYNKLNAFFAEHSYYQNYALSALDVKIYNQIKCVIDKDMYPHLYRWYKHISSLPSAVLDQYTENTDKGKKGNTDEKKTNAKKSPAAADDDDVDNDIDLFGDSNNDDKNILLEKKKEKEEELKKKKQKEKEKNRSILIIEIKPKSIDTDISKIPKLVKQKIVDENIKWGEEVKKLPVAFGLYKIHMSCIIYDDFVNTNELIDKIENIDLESEEDKKKRTLILGLDDEENEDYDGDENAEVEDDLDFLVHASLMPIYTSSCREKAILANNIAQVDNKKKKKKKLHKIATFAASKFCQSYEQYSTPLRLILNYKLVSVSTDLSLPSCLVLRLVSYGVILFEQTELLSKLMYCTSSAGFHAVRTSFFFKCLQTLVKYRHQFSLLKGSLVDKSKSAFCDFLRHVHKTAHLSKFQMNAIFGEENGMKRGALL
ncbi:translation elongation factor, putative [Plasmodium ovale wallikeri]|uniref:Translation elongation factor, putative n=1 Tax=Plasmodium ovale wallikeri TaxID=864142 RepID=A0A1A8YQS8_PLAOA|nr:translation elongation factor, putative [Plasmodium ovale wallikeri]